VSEQRLRVYFRKGERVRYISHLDVMRFWERAIRRAGLPLTYSKGFNPHPKLQFAGPLPLGFTGQREIIDVFLDDRISEEHFRSAVEAQSTADLEIVDVQEVPLSAPAPQAVLTWADYTVEIPGLPYEEAVQAVEAFLARESFPFEEQRNERTRQLDLRTGTARLDVLPADGGVTLSIRARAGQDVNVRPEVLVEALFPGHTAVAISRDTLVLDEPSPAREAWLRRGRFDE
jgi:radical SAM-linked protein